nr:PEP/pyruvate-binding domain-containing protein [uncultured Actinomyces sp.]
MTDVEVVGGKNASLGELISQLSASGVQVPGGFATTADAFRDFLDHNRLTERINARLATLNTDDVKALAQAGAEIAALTRALDGDASCAVIVADPAAVRGRRRGNLVLVARQAPFTASELEEVERAVRRLPLPVRTWSLNDAAVPRPEGG